MKDRNTDHHIDDVGHSSETVGKTSDLYIYRFQEVQLRSGWIRYECLHGGKSCKVIPICRHRRKFEKRIICFRNFRTDRFIQFMQ